MISIAWSEFTPWSALVGGLVIGLAAALLFVMNGRIAGISGVVGGLLGAGAGDRSWRLAFAAGLILAPSIWALVAVLPEARINADYLQLVFAGLLVGVGTRYAGGCTSGHGVCGLARFSLRSLVATLTFMAAGFVTVYFLRHVGG